MKNSHSNKAQKYRLNKIHLFFFAMELARTKNNEFTQSKESVIK